MVGAEGGARVQWGYAVGVLLLAIAAGAWLRRRSYRVADDVVHRPLPGWLLPVLASVGVVLATPFFLGRPGVVIATYGLALVWGLLLAFIDLDIRWLPPLLTLGGYPVFGTLLAICSAVTGDWTALARAAACAGIAVGLFLLVQLAGNRFRPDAEALGGGDVKLVGTLGLLLGWSGWWNALYGFTTGLVLAGLIAVVLLVTRRADRSSHLAYGPPLLIGAYVWAALPPLV